MAHSSARHAIQQTPLRLHTLPLPIKAPVTTKFALSAEESPPHVGSLSPYEVSGEWLPRTPTPVRPQREALAHDHVTTLNWQGSDETMRQAP